MWIARDKDGALYIYASKPVREGDMFSANGEMLLTTFTKRCMQINRELYPNVTWENSPKELIIKTEESEGEMIRTDKELVEEVYSHLESIKETVDRMTSGNFMHHKAAIKFSANTIQKVLELMGLNVH